MAFCYFLNMTGFGPWDVLQTLVLWWGVPALVIVPISLALAVLEWRRLGLAAARAARSAGTSALNLESSTIGGRVVAVAVAGLSQALSICLVFVLIKVFILVGVVYDNGVIWLPTGSPFSWPGFLEVIFNYPLGETPWMALGWGILGWMLATNLAIFSKVDAVARLVLKVGYVIPVAVSLFSIVLVIAGAVLILDALTSSAASDKWLTVGYYAFWLVLPYLTMVLGVWPFIYFLSLAGVELD